MYCNSSIFSSNLQTSCLSFNSLGRFSNQQILFPVNQLAYPPMKTSVIFPALLLTIFFLSPSAQAQNKNKIGLGVGLNTSALIGAITEGAFVSSTGIYLPISMPPTIRFEPNVAFARTVSKNDTAKESDAAIQVGAGLFTMQSVNTATQIYFGVRAGAAFNQSKSSFGPNSTTRSKTDFFVGPAFGGEYFFSDNFSLGAEAQLVMVFFGSYDDDSEVSTNLLFTNSIFFTRVYF